jgi:hypothetical protein
VLRAACSGSRVSGRLILQKDRPHRGPTHWFFVGSERLFSQD